MAALLEVSALTGGYSRTQPVIHQVSFEVKPKQIVALIGLNGAGKSTTIKHILGLLHAHEGSITIQGSTFGDDPHTYRSLYSYIPETPVYYDEMNLMEHLEFTAMVHGLDRKTFQKRMDPLLREFRMDKRKNMFPTQFSKGMKQKLMIMMALLVQPPLYIVDEPLVGLDPLGIRSLLGSLEQCKQDGAGILMSTHILSTAERYCDQFVILHEGRVIAKGNLKQLQKQSGLKGATLDDIYLKLTEEAEEGRHDNAQKP